MLKKKTIFLLFLPLILSACSISFNTGTGSGTNGGLFISESKGDKWTQRILIPTNSGRPKSISGVDANALAMDPSDNKALYLASVENGLFYTYDAGQNWQIAQSLGQIDVRAVAIDAQDKCTVYAASFNKVYKTDDCSRSWKQVYYDNDVTVTVNSISVDHYNGANVYIALSRGDILKSTDRGVSWRAIKRVDDKIVQLSLNPNDSRMIFICTKEKGIIRSSDSGGSWTDLSDKLKEFNEGNNCRDLAFSKVKPGLIILANRYGLIRSTDNGNTWQKIDLLTPEKEATINAVTINSNNADEIYYVTNTTFYRTADGGKNWSTVKLPTTRAGKEIIIDPQNGSLMYLAVRTQN